MCQANPQLESMTRWGYTEEEILHRWKVYQMFDPITRLFGSEDKDEKPSIQAPAINSAAMMSTLESLLQGN